MNQSRNSENLDNNSDAEANNNTSQNISKTKV